MGQHREIHMLAAAIQKNKMQSHPLTKFWQTESNWNGVVWYHNLIVREMVDRGMRGHKTPLVQDMSDRVKLPTVTDEMICFDIVDLLCRWTLHGQHGKPRLAIPDRAVRVETVFEPLLSTVQYTKILKQDSSDVET